MHVHVCVCVCVYERGTYECIEQEKKKISDTLNDKKKYIETDWACLS